MPDDRKRKSKRGDTPPPGGGSGGGGKGTGTDSKIDPRLAPKAPPGTVPPSTSQAASKGSGPARPASFEDAQASAFDAERSDTHRQASAEPAEPDWDEAVDEWQRSFDSPVKPVNELGVDARLLREDTKRPQTASRSPFGGQTDDEPGTIVTALSEGLGLEVDEDAEQLAGSRGETAAFAGDDATPVVRTEEIFRKLFADEITQVPGQTPVPQGEPEPPDDRDEPLAESDLSIMANLSRAGEVSLITDLSEIDEVDELSSVSIIENVSELSAIPILDEDIEITSWSEKSEASQTAVGKPNETLLAASKSGQPATRVERRVALGSLRKKDEAAPKTLAGTTAAKKESASKHEEATPVKPMPGQAPTARRGVLGSGDVGEPADISYTTDEESSTQALTDALYDELVVEEDWTSSVWLRKEGGLLRPPPLPQERPAGESNRGVSAGAAGRNEDIDDPTQVAVGDTPFESELGTGLGPAEGALDAATNVRFFPELEPESGSDARARFGAPGRLGGELGHDLLGDADGPDDIEEVDEPTEIAYAHAGPVQADWGEEPPYVPPVLPLPPLGDSLERTLSAGVAPDVEEIEASLASISAERKHRTGTGGAMICFVSSQLLIRLGRRQESATLLGLASEAGLSLAVDGFVRSSPASQDVGQIRRALDLLVSGQDGSGQTDDAHGPRGGHARAKGLGRSGAVAERGRPASSGSGEADIEIGSDPLDVIEVIDAKDIATRELLRAGLEMRLGEWESASGAFERAAGAAPDLRTLCQLGLFSGAIERGRHDEALSRVTTLSSTDERVEASLRTEEGRLGEWLGEDSRARQAYETGWRASPGLGAMSVGLSRVTLRLGDAAGASQARASEGERAPTCAGSLRRRAALLAWAAGDLDEGIALLQGLKTPLAYETLFELAAASGRFDDAENALVELAQVEKDAGRVGFALFRLAELREARGDLDAAAQAYEQSATTFPSMAAQRGFSRVCAEHSNVSRRVASLRAAAEADLSIAPWLYTRIARLEGAVERRQEMRDALSRAIELDSSFGPARMELGVVGQEEPLFSGDIFDKMAEGQSVRREAAVLFEWAAEAAAAGGDQALAMARYRRALERDPGGRAVRWALVWSDVYATAIESRLVQDPSLQAALREQKGLLLLSEDPRAAIAELRSALLANPALPGAAGAMVWHLGSDPRQSADLAELFLKRAEVASAGAKGRPEASALYVRAAEHLARGRHDQAQGASTSGPQPEHIDRAISAYRHALTLTPTFESALLGLGEIAPLAEEPKLAIEACSFLSEHATSPAEAAYWSAALATAYEQRKQWGEAAKAWQSVMESHGASAAQSAYAAAPGGGLARYFWLRALANAGAHSAWREAKLVDLRSHKQQVGRGQTSGDGRSESSYGNRDIDSVTHRLIEEILAAELLAPGQSPGAPLGGGGDPEENSAEMAVWNQLAAIDAGHPMVMRRLRGRYFLTALASAKGDDQASTSGAKSGSGRLPTAASSASGLKSLAGRLPSLWEQIDRLTDDKKFGALAETWASLADATANDHTTASACALRAGVAALKAGDRTSALAHFNRAANLDPDNLVAQHERFYAALLGKAWPDALDSGERLSVLFRAPGAVAHFAMLTALLAEHRLVDANRAIVSYRRVLACQPENEFAFTRLEHLLEVAGEVGQVVDLIEERLRTEHHQTRIIDLRLRAGNLLLELTENAEASRERAGRHFAEVLRLRPAHLEALRALIDLEMQAGRTDQAIELLLRLTSIEKEPLHLRDAYFDLGQLRRERLGDFEGSLEAFGQALSLTPDDPLVLEQVRQLFVAKRDFTNARKATERMVALSANPIDKKRLLLALADLQRDLGEGRAAIETIRRACEVDPDDLDLAATLVEALGSDTQNRRLYLEQHVAALQRRIFSAPLEIEAWRKLRQVHMWREAPALAQVATHVLEMLGDRSPENLELLDRLGRRLEIAPFSLHDVEIEEQLYPPTLPKPFRDLVALLGEILGQSARPDLKRFGVEKRSRLAKNHVLSRMSMRLAPTLGESRELEWHRSTQHPRIFMVEPGGDHPTVVIGSALCDAGAGGLPEPEARFWVGRAVGLLATRLNLPAQMVPEALGALVGGVVWLFLPDYSHPGIAPSTLLESSQKLAKLIPKERREALRTLALECSSHLDFGELVRAAQGVPVRAGLLASADIFGTVRGLLKEAGTTVPPGEGRGLLVGGQISSTLVDLLRFLGGKGFETFCAFQAAPRLPQY